MSLCWSTEGDWTCVCARLRVCMCASACLCVYLWLKKKGLVAGKRCCAPAWLWPLLNTRLLMSVLVVASRCLQPEDTGLHWSPLTHCYSILASDEEHQECCPFARDRIICLKPMFLSAAGRKLKNKQTSRKKKQKHKQMNKWHFPLQAWASCGEARDLIMTSPLW